MRTIAFVLFAVVVGFPGASRGDDKPATQGTTKKKAPIAKKLPKQPDQALPTRPRAITIHEIDHDDKRVGDRECEPNLLGVVECKSTPTPVQHPVIR